jgi:hypothetical protein
VSNELWIEIVNWNKFQHYRDRVPPWIKIWTRLVHDPNWTGLTAARKGLLVSLWLERSLQARAKDEVDTDLRGTWMRIRISSFNASHGLAAKMKDYEALNHAGFITIRASNLRRTRARVREETEREELSNSNSEVHYEEWIGELSTQGEQP